MDAPAALWHQVKIARAWKPSQQAPPSHWRRRPTPRHPCPYRLRVAGQGASEQLPGRKGRPCPPPGPSSPAPGLRPPSGHCFLGMMPAGRGLRTQRQTPSRRPAGAAAGVGELQVDSLPRDPAQRCSADRRASLLISTREFPRPRPSGPAPQAPPFGRPTPQAPPQRSAPPFSSTSRWSRPRAGLMRTAPRCQCDGREGRG